MKRLFFGLSVEAPWPQPLPEGRLLEENSRHLTLAFLGQTDEDLLLRELAHFPKISSFVGTSGYFEKALFLPEDSPRVAAWQAHFYSEKAAILHTELGSFLHRPQEKWLPHVTLSRKPFDELSWQNNFHQLPFITKDLHLYESLGNSTYTSLWTYSFAYPFEEIEHTADIAFIVRGDTLQELYEHAFTALCFKYPPLLNHFIKQPVEDLDQIVISLNNMIAAADSRGGCPLKAVSFHGSIQKKTFLEWEMIVDV